MYFYEKTKNVSQRRLAVGLVYKYPSHVQWEHATSTTVVLLQGYVVMVISIGFPPLVSFAKNQLLVTDEPVEFET